VLIWAIAQVTMEVELSAVAGANKRLLITGETQQAAHVRADAREGMNLPATVDQEALHGPHHERLDRAVGKCGEIGNRHPAALCSD